MNQTELLDQFILEARDCLEQVGQRLLEVEKNPHDTELLNDLFRQVHTLKGNCGLFEFKPLERVVHAGEDVLDRVRNGTLSYSNDIADALLEAMDFTAQMVDEIEQTGGIAAAAEGRSQTLSTALRAHLSAKPAVQAPPAPVAAHQPQSTAPVVEAAAVAPRPAWLSRVPQALADAHPDAVAWCYRPEAECFFKGEDPWLLAKQAPAIKHLDVGGQIPWAQAAEGDCYQCNLDLVGLSDAPIAYLSEHFRCVPEQVELIELKSLAPAGGQPGASASACTGAASAETRSNPNASSPAPEASPGAPHPAKEGAVATQAADTLRKRALQIWDDQIALLGRKGVAAGTVTSVRHALIGLLQSIGDEPCLHRLAELQQTPGSMSASALVQWATRHRPTAGQPASPEPQAEHPDDHPASVGGEGLPPAGGGSGDGARRSGDDGGHQKVLKVGQEKIDRLMDLIGEMVVAKNALPYLAQRAESHFQQRELAREIKAQYAVINRIAEDMQHAIMQVRMMPVGTVFQRFGRLVRDISRKLGKDVALVIDGEETEADKNIIESLADPLIHIIRNSLDHGIEMPEVRQKAGKPAQGTIRVAARQESDRVILEIDDDGAGVDPQRVRRKAIERGLIPEDKAQNLTDTEAVQLIFLPGFSTADAISDLSGRGVGMDVVRTAVERINGHVELSSQFGKGTRLRLSLPLSMAVTNVMIIEAGGRRFGVPMDLIVETVRVHAEDIHHFKQARTTVLRGRIVPLRALHDLLALDDGPSVNEDGEHAVLVVRFGGENVGLLVDHFHGATDIILKPLEGVLAGLTGFAGTALMGDGSVLMILNPKELV
jgi:two-component system chemotaxis sensor kinase CheA